MPGGLRRLDAFAKTRPDLRSRSALGGFITFLAASSAAALFLAQIYMYIVGDTRHFLRLSRSTSVPLMPLDRKRSILQMVQGKVPLRIHVTFPHLTCSQLDVVHDNASLRDGSFAKIHGDQTLNLRSPTRFELEQALGGSAVYDSKGRGCTIEGTMRIPIVAGHLVIALSKATWNEAQRTFGFGGKEALAKDNNYNVSHYIHSIRFGKLFPLAQDNPLEDHSHVIDNSMGGIALERVTVKLIPTLYETMFRTQKTYQLSVVDLTVQPETLVAYGSVNMPGLSISYDFTPLAVHHIEDRDNIFVFISSLVSIVGGVFVTVGLVTGCLVKSAAAAVSKKID